MKMGILYIVAIERTVRSVVEVLLFMWMLIYYLNLSLDLQLNIKKIESISHVSVSIEISQKTS